MNPDSGKVYDEEQMRILQEVAGKGPDAEQLAKLKEYMQEPVSQLPETWPRFAIGEQVTIKGEPFRLESIDKDKSIFTFRPWKLAVRG